MLWLGAIISQKLQLVITVVTIVSVVGALIPKPRRLRRDPAARRRA